MSVNEQMPEETPRLFDAFISYSSLDSDVATRLEEDLKQEGFEVWLDKREVLVGHNIVDRVSLGLSDSRFVLLLLSSSSIQSEWVKSEWTAAYVTEIESKNVVILPGLVEPCTIPTVLLGKKYADLTNWETGLQEIVTAMKGHSSAVAVRTQKPTHMRREIISEPAAIWPVYLPGTPLAELFIGGVLFTGIPKTKMQNLSFLMHVGQYINVTVGLDREDTFLMGAMRFEDGHTWKWNQDDESIPCMVVCVDTMSGEYSRYTLPTVHQVNRLLTRSRQVIFLFLIEDSSGSDIVGVNLCVVGTEAFELRSTYISFLV